MNKIQVFNTEIISPNSVQIRSWS